MTLKSGTVSVNGIKRNWIKKRPDKHGERKNKRRNGYVVYAAKVEEHNSAVALKMFIENLKD